MLCHAVPCHPAAPMAVPSPARERLVHGQQQLALAEGRCALSSRHAVHTLKAHGALGALLEVAVLPRTTNWKL